MAMLTRRRFAQLSGLATGWGGSGGVARAAESRGQPDVSDFTIEIAPYLLEASPKHRFQTIAYNGQVPGPLLRMQEGREVSVTVVNKTSEPEVVHWHGLFLPSEVDGAMEEGTPMIPAGATTTLRFRPEPAGFRWFHTHTSAGGDLRKAQYGGQRGFLMGGGRGRAGFASCVEFVADGGALDCAGRAQISGGGAGRKCGAAATDGGYAAAGAR